MQVNFPLTSSKWGGKCGKVTIFLAGRNMLWRSFDWVRWTLCRLRETLRRLRGGRTAHEQKKTKKGNKFTRKHEISPKGAYGSRGCGCCWSGCQPRVLAGSMQVIRAQGVFHNMADNEQWLYPQVSSEVTRPPLKGSLKWGQSLEKTRSVAASLSRWDDHPTSLRWLGKRPTGFDKKDN